MFRILCIFAIGIVGFGHPMTRELSTSPFPINKVDINKKLNNMPKKITTEDFVAKASKKHPNIDFGKVSYVSAITDITLVCKKCGLEWRATPNSILNGSGCPHCSRTKLILGVGVNDVPVPTRSGNIRNGSYRVWKSMLERCYSVKYQRKEPAYIGCSVCEEWKVYSVFKRWFDENYVEGCALDKDILVKGNKVYSPDTCCFVPQEINGMLSNCGSHNKKNGVVGVHVDKRIKKNKYIASVSQNGCKKEIGRFQTKEEAFAAYKFAKEAHVKKMAELYLKNGKITEKVYNALMSYKVEITD